MARPWEAANVNNTNRDEPAGRIDVMLSQRGETAVAQGSRDLRLRLPPFSDGGFDAVETAGTQCTAIQNGYQIGC